MLVVLACSCSKEKASHGTSTRAFYYWQTSMDQYPWNDSTFHALDVDRVYFRFFDVDWSEEAKAPVPVSPLETYYASVSDSIDVVPVVFITNETFKNLDVRGSAELAAHVYKKVMSQLSGFMFSSFRYESGWWEQNPYQVKSRTLKEQARWDSAYAAGLKKIREIQFDCDWTKSTKDKYFAFLTESKKLFRDYTVTSTVRLYQYKYPNEAGLPPVDRGMLMCYNAGKIGDKETTNSVFDKAEVLKYLDADRYSIPLDYALPIFEWAVWFQNGKISGILPGDLISGDYAFNFEHKKDNVYVVKQDFVLGYTKNSKYLRKGDEVRVEAVEGEDVKEVAEWLSEHKNNSSAAITFYHLNDDDLKKHSETIKSIFSTF